MKEQRTPSEVLQMFVDLFVSSGRLNQTIRIRRHDKRYRICCSEKEFLAYRINDHGGVSHGFPGWPVCIVTPDLMFEESGLSAFASAEPGVYDWLRCIEGGDFDPL